MDRLIDRLEDPAIHVDVMRVLHSQVERLGLACTLGLDVEADIGGIVVDAAREGTLAAVREIGSLDREDLVRLAMVSRRHGFRVLTVEVEVEGGVSDIQDDVVHILNLHLIEGDVHN